MNQDASESLAGARLVDAVSSEFERALAAGQSPQIEVFLSKVPPPNRQSLLLELLGAEVDFRVAKGQRPTAGDYSLRFPELPVEQLIGILDAPRIAVAATPAKPLPGALPFQPTVLSPTDAVEAVNEVGADPQLVGYFGDYELRREIARGGMGVVYEARQKSLNRPVALKMILAGQLAGPEAVARFRREAEAAAQLEHPGIVPIFEIGTHGDQHYFTMGYVAGPSLSARLLDRPLEPREAALLMRDVALAVQYAHERGVVHRDLKPSNILLGPQTSGTAGELPYLPRVTDFGLAKLTSSDHSLTETGQIMGTPSYMPPEQAAGLSHEVGPAADVYSLGAMLYACLTGRPPFQAASVVDTVRQVLERDPVSPRELNAAIPRDLETISLRCLEKSIPRRYGSAKAVAEELQRYLDGRPIQARPVSRRERVSRWCRRNPVVAGLISAVALSLLVGIVVSSYFAWKERQRAVAESAAKEGEKRERVEAQKQTGIANRQTQIAVAAQKTAEQAKQAEMQRAAELRHTLYLADAVRWKDLADRGQTAELKRLLQRQIPQPGQTDHRGFDWYYWWQQLQQSNTVAVFPAAVDRLAHSPDGRLVAVGCQGGRCYFWDVAEARLRGAVLSIEGEHWTTMEFTADSSRFYATSERGDPKQWEVATGRVLAQGFPINMSRLEMPRAPAAFAADGDLFFGRLSRAGLGLWNLPQEERVGLPVSAGVYVSQIAGQGLDTVTATRYRIFPGSSNPDFIASIDSSDSSSVLFRPGHSATRPTELGPPIFGATMTPDGCWLVCGTREGQVLLVNTQSRQITQRWRGHQGIVWAVAISADGKWVMSGGEDGVAKVWNSERAEEVVTYSGHRAPLRCVQFLPDGQAASAGDDGELHIWGRLDGSLRRRLIGHEGAITALQVRPDGEELWTAGVDRTVRRWAGKVAKDRWSQDFPTSHQQVAASHDGSVVVAVDTASLYPLQSLHVWNHQTHAYQRSFGYTPESHNNQLALSRNGALIATLQTSGVRLYDPSTQLWRECHDVCTKDEAGMLREIPWNKREANATTVGIEKLRSLDFSPNDRQLVVLSRREIEGRPPAGQLRVRDVLTGEALETLPLDFDAVSQCRFSPNGKWLAIAGPQAVQFWEWERRRPLQTVKITGTTDAEVCSLAWAPFGDRLAMLIWHSATSSTSTWLCEGEGWQKVRSLSGPDEGGTPLACVFAPDGDHLLLASRTHLIVQKVADGAVQSARGYAFGFELPDPARGQEPRWSISLADSGRTVLAPGTAGQILRCDWAAQASLAPLETPGRAVTDLEWSTQGNQLWGAVEKEKVAKGMSLVGWRGPGVESVTSQFKTNLGFADRPFCVGVGGHAPPTEIRFDVDALSRLLKDPQIAVTPPEYLPEIPETYHAALSDNSQVAITALRSSLILWRAVPGTGNRQFQPTHHLTLHARRVAWAPGSRHCALALTHGVAVIDLDGKILWRSSDLAATLALAWSRDGRFLIGVGDDGLVSRWTSSGELVRNYRGHVGSVTCVTLPADGRTVITGGEDRWILVFDFASGDLRTRLGPLPAAIRSVAVSSDGTQLASTGDDRIVRTWRAASVEAAAAHRESVALSAAPVTELPLVSDSHWGPKSDPRAARDAALAKALHEHRMDFTYDALFSGREGTYAPFATQKNGAAPAIVPAPLPAFDLFVTQVPSHRVRPDPRPVFPVQKLALLSGLQRLRSLSLEGAAVTNADLQVLTDLPALTLVNFARTKLTDGSWPFLKTMPALHDVRLEDTAVGDITVTDLSALPGLRHLNLRNTSVTDVGTAALAHAEALETLDLGGTQVTDKGLEGLRQLPALHFVNLSRTAVTDSGLLKLAAGKSVVEIVLDGTPVTLDGVIAALAVNSRLRMRVDEAVTKGNADLREALLSRGTIDSTNLTPAELVRRIRDGGRITAWTGSPAELAANNFALLDELQALESLDVRGPYVNLPLEPLLKAADRLRSLRLEVSSSKSRVVDDALETIAGLHRLQRLHISGPNRGLRSNLTAAGIEWIKRLPLEALRLEYCDGVPVQVICDAFPELRELSLRGCEETKELVGLRRLPRLEVLNLGAVRFHKSDGLLFVIASLPRLSWLSAATTGSVIRDPRLTSLMHGGLMPEVLLTRVNAVAVTQPAETASELPVQRLSQAQAERINNALLRVLDTDQGVGVAAALVLEGEVVFANAHGLADRERQIPATVATKFNWVWGSQLLTTVMAMQLVQEGRLKLDDTIDQFGFDLPAAYAKITVRHLLCGQSGLPPIGGPTVVRNPREHISATPFLDPVNALDTFNRSPLEFKPGTKELLTGNGFILLSAIVQKAGGEPHNAQVERRVVRPLGLDSFELDSPTPGPKNWATGYVKQKERIERVPEFFQYWTHGAGGYKSNILDYASFAQALLTDRLITADTRRLMFTPQKLADGTPTTMALSLRHNQGGGVQQLDMESWDGKTRTLLTLFPENRTAVVVMSNTPHVNPASFSKAVLSSLPTSGGQIVPEVPPPAAPPTEQVKGSPSPAVAPFDAQQARKHQEDWAAHLGVPLEHTSPAGMRFVLIPPGEFLMGETPEQLEENLKFVARSMEHWRECTLSMAPRHKVILTKPFYLGVHEVTQEQYQKMMKKNPAHFASTGTGRETVAGLDTKNFPVEMVSWSDAAEFSAKLSLSERLKPYYSRTGATVRLLDGNGYRLPTEAEWQFACRAGTTTHYWLGDREEDLAPGGWYGANSGGRPHAVGELKQNPFGLHDMQGNVYEWVQDWWGLHEFRLRGNKPAVDPTGPSGGAFRGFRGGCWAHSPWECRSEVRSSHGSLTMRRTHGFRLVLSVPARQGNP